MPYLLALMASVFTGISDFTGGFLSKRVSEYAVTGMASAVACAAYLLMGRLAGDLDLTRVDFRAGALGGVFFLIANVLYFKALADGQMGVVGGTVTLLVIVPMLWGARNGQPLTTVALVGVAITIGGVILLGVPEMSATGGFVPVVMAAVAAIFYGMTQVAVDVGSDKSVFATMFAVQAVSVVFVLILGAVTRSTGGLTRSAIPLLLVIGLTDAISLWSFTEATTAGDIGIVSVLSSLDPIVIALLAAFFLKEKLSRIQIFAIGVVIAGTAVISQSGAAT